MWENKSKYPKGVPLYIGPEHGVQAIACREIDRDRKCLLEKLLDADEFAQAKLLGSIMIDE